MFILLYFLELQECLFTNHPHLSLLLEVDVKVDVEPVVVVLVLVAVERGAVETGNVVVILPGESAHKARVLKDLPKENGELRNETIRLVRFTSEYQGYRSVLIDTAPLNLLHCQDTRSG